MKDHWYFLAALGIVVALVGCYLMDWVAAAWIITAVLMFAPLVFIVGVYLWDQVTSNRGIPALSMSQDAAPSFGAEQPSTAVDFASDPLLARAEQAFAAPAPKPAPINFRRPTPSEVILGLTCPHCGEAAMPWWRKLYVTFVRAGKPQIRRVCWLGVWVSDLRVIAWIAPIPVFVVATNLLVAAGVVQGDLLTGVFVPVAIGLVLLAIVGMVFGTPLDAYGCTDSEIVRQALEKLHRGQ